MKTATCFDINHQSFEIPVEQLVFRPSAHAVVIDNGKILLSRQWGGYDLPGGGIERGETIEEALLREVKEETGMIVSIDKIVTCEDSFFRSSQGHYFQGIMLYYRCRSVSGELTTAFLDQYEKEYADMPEWVDLSTIDSLKFVSTVDTLKVIRKALE